MNRIKFDDVMNFYPKHNRSIYSKIVEAQKSNSLIPFVGAGMSDKSELLFPQEWEQDPRQLSFLEKLLGDYSDRLREQSAYWNTFFLAKPQNILPARIYGHTLWGYADNYPDGAEIAVDRLAQLYDEMNHDTEIAEFYANGLILLSLNQNMSEHNEAVGALEKLYQNHSDISEVVVAYAKGLVNLSCYQDLEGRIETITRLDKLYQNHPSISEVVFIYANGLVSLLAIRIWKAVLKRLHNWINCIKTIQTGKI